MFTRMATAVLIVLLTTPALSQVIVRPPPPPPPPPPRIVVPELPKTPTCRQVCIPTVCQPGQVCPPNCTMQCN